MKRLRVGICLLLWSVNSIAQIHIVCEGRIKDAETGLAVSDVICSAVSLNEVDLLAYTMSDKDGQYQLHFSATTDSVLLRFALLGYKTVLIPIGKTACRQDIIMEPSRIQLREVTVKASPVWTKGDTINYRVDAFRGQQDRVIGDVLEKIPGLKVGEKGTITYQGKPINRFYIEGMDLMRNKYGIATRSIPADVIEQVQILENHQPIKLLREREFSEQAALNLKLKSDKIGQFVGNAEAGAGLSDRAGIWQGKLTGMEIMRRWQSLFTFKTNNIGDNLSDELSDQRLELADLLDGVPSYPSDLMEPENLQTLPVEEKRYMWNQSYSATLNQLWRVNDDSQLRLSLAYLKDRNKQHIENMNRYWLGTEELEWNTVSRLRDDTHMGEAVFSWTTNASALYVDEELKLYGKWDKVTSDITGSQQVGQHFKLPLYLVQNKLDLLKSMGKKNWRFYSFLRYSGQPQHLSVVADTVDISGIGLLKQNTNRQQFYTLNRSGFSWTKGKSLFKMGVSFTAALENLKSGLYPGIFETERSTNRLGWNRWEYGIQPEYVLKGEQSRLEIAVPLQILDLSANPHINVGKIHYTRLWAFPSWRFYHTFSPYWSSKISYGMRKELGEMSDFAEGIRMVDFRTFRRGIASPEQRLSHTFSVAVSYRNPLRIMFFNLSAIYRLQHVNQVSVISFGENYTLHRRINKNSNRRYWIINGSLGKYWDAWKTNLAFDAGYTRTLFEQFQQSNQWNVIAYGLHMGAQLDIGPTDWSRLRLKAEYAGNKIETSGYASQWLSDWKTRAAAYFFPTSRWQFALKGEYVQNKLIEIPDLRLFFMDTELKYISSYCEVSLICGNILNKRFYSSSSYDGRNSYSSSYDLRGRSLLVSCAFKL